MAKKNRFGCLLLMAAVVMGATAFCGRQEEISWRAGSDAWETVENYAQARGISAREYPRSLVELLDRNPETKEFVLNYPFRQEEKIRMRDFDRSRGVPLMMQWDTRWGYIKYGSDVVGITGCGPLCLSMAGYYLTGDSKFSPDKVVEFALENGYNVSGSGSSWTLISEGGVKLGLDVIEIPLVKQRILDNLEAGNPIICVMGPGDFTTTGHFIVLVGEEDGLLRVNDPNSKANSEKLWKFEDIECQFRNLWVIRK